MGRHERRAKEAAARHAAVGCYWHQKADPSDPSYVLVEFRIPNGGMPTASYKGGEAMDRIKRFCVGYLQGFMQGVADRAADEKDDSEPEKN